MIGRPAPTALVGLVDRFPFRRVLVVGDVMLDHFLYGRVNRISPEAPVPVVEFDHEEFRLGGAANVAHNVQAFGGAAVVVGLVGEDEAGRQVAQCLAGLGLPTDGLVATSDRPTTRKMRVVTTRNQQVARVDYEADRDATGATESAIVRRALAALGGVEAVVVSDYLKGVVTAGLMAHLVGDAAVRGVPVLVDPKIPHIDHYRGATLITPNHHEAEVATATRIRSDDDARAAARAFRVRAGCPSVLITRGEHGMWLLDGAPSDAGDEKELSLPAAAREVADVTGAGDTVIATMALAMAAGASLAQAATLANHAAGISVSRFGPATVTCDELLASLS